MSVTVKKTCTPVTNTIVAPLNEGTDMTQGMDLIFRLGSSEVPYWLVQSSFLRLDIELESTNDDGDVYDCIRSAAMIFSDVWVRHASTSNVYDQHYNIEAAFLDMIKNGSAYLNSQLGTYTTSDNFKISKCAKPGSNNKTKKFTGIIIPIPILLKCFENATTIPLIALNQQMEIRLRVSDPSRFMVQYVDKEDENPNGRFTAPAVGTYSGIKITKAELYIAGENVDNDISSAEIAEYNEGKAFTYKYTKAHINTRLQPAGPKNSQYNINFSVSTENTKSIYVYSYQNDLPSLSYRPDFINTNIQFGRNYIPYSPVNVSAWEFPSYYKTLVDSVLDIQGSRFTTSNKDYNLSYDPITTDEEAATAKQDTHIILAGDFIVDNDLLGASSKQWNSQYNLKCVCNSNVEAAYYCLLVESEHILTIKDGNITDLNL